MIKKQIKSIKISKGVHKKVKLHVTKTEEGITEFSDKALLNQIKLENGKK